MSQLRYYKNLNEELKEKIVDFENDFIDVFQGGKYSDEIRHVYNFLLSKNVSVNNCEDVIRTVLEKLANTKCGKLPKKSIASEMFTEMMTVT